MNIWKKCIMTLCPCFLIVGCAKSAYDVKITEPIIIGKAFYDDYALVLRLYEGEYRTEYSAGPNFGPNWVGKYDLAIIDILSGEVIYNYLLKEWGEELLFKESVALTLTDYNMDGVLEILIGQYGSQNYNTYNMYYITEASTIGYYSEIGTLSISSEDMSPQLEVKNGSIQYPLYDNSSNTMNMRNIGLDALLVTP